MNDLLNFIYESGICLAVLFGLYWLILRKETYFRFNRFYLLGTIIIACLLPFGHLNLINSGASSLGVLPRLVDAIRIPELTTIDGSNSVNVTPNSWQIIMIVIYLIGASLLIFRMILGIIRVTMLKRRGRISNHNGYSIVQMKKEIAPCSFFKTIFISNTLVESSDENYIINHEIIHIKQLHTYDNLFVEFFLAIFWFNPFIWLIRGALRNTHEYLADNGVISETPSPAKYQSLLLNQITGLIPIVVTSSFNSTIKNRIKMIHRNKSSVVAKFKPLLFLPVLACLTLLFACNEKDADLSENIDLVITPQKPEFPEGEELFFVVEDMPTFNGGDPAIEFRKFVAQNLKYPEAAHKDSISGRVIVQFTVNKEGSVENAVIVRSVDPYLDEEALRVVNSSPKWTPGKQSGKEVNVQFTFPLNFVLQ